MSRYLILLVFSPLLPQRQKGKKDLGHSTHCRKQASCEYTSCTWSQVNSTRLSSCYILFSSSASLGKKKKKKSWYCYLNCCPQDRLLLNIKCITADSCSRKSRGREAPGLRRDLKLQAGEAEVFLLATIYTKNLCCQCKEPTTVYQAQDIFVNLSSSK